MESVVLITAFWSLALAAGVVVINPRRFANQAFALLALTCCAWSACVYIALALEHKQAMSAALHWYLADNVCAAFFPWANSLLLHALILPDRKPAIIARASGPWFAIALALVGIALGPAFILPAQAPGGPLERGVAYFAYTLIQVVADLMIVIRGARELEHASGLRRIEIQCLILNVGMTCILVGLLNGLGSLLHRTDLKLLGFPIVLCALAIVAWAMTVHRVFDMRQVFLSVVHRVACIGVILTIAIWLHAVLATVIKASTSLLGSIAVAAAAGMWLHTSSRRWFGLDGRPITRRIRESALELSKVEPRTENLVAAFEALLRKECRTEIAAIAYEPGDAADKPIPRRDDAAYHALCRTGWVTPESAHRRRRSPGVARLQQYLEERKLGLLVAIPRGNPSLLLALGTKVNGGPYTYPEIERLMGIAELMDNILARSRLTTQAALQAKTEHLAMMSRGLAHDLKNLITPIDSFLVHTERQLRPGTVEAEVHESAKRSVRIISEYVGEALFFANRLKPQLGFVDLDALLTAVSEVTSRRANARAVRVGFSHSPCPALLADRVLLQRLLANLVNNAIDASPSGTSVTVSIAPVTDDAVRFEVSDQGCGIPDANLKRVFDPYFTTKEFGEEVRGFGLGLTICQKIVALHGGTISLRSQIGAGTTVTVDLPSRPPVAANADSASGATLRSLVPAGRSD